MSNSKSLLDRDLETDLNRNIDLILTNAEKLTEERYQGQHIDIPDVTFQDAVRQIRETANHIISVTSMLDKNTGPAEQYQQDNSQEDGAVKSASVLLLCSQIRYLQKLTIAMRIKLDE